MPKLSKRDWLILVAIALAGVEVVVGVLISHTVALVLLPIFLLLLVLTYYKAVRAKDDITSSDVREFQHRAKRRKSYLPSLQEALEALLDKQHELTTKAGQMSLEEYRDRFLKHSLRYKLIRIMVSGRVGRMFGRFALKDEKEIILMALRQENFVKNNLYVRELEQKEDYQKLWREYNKWYSKTYETPLRILVAILVRLERQLSSTSAMVEVARRETAKSPTILALLYKSEAKLKDTVETQRKLVNDEFRELLEDVKPD